ncbi:MAG: hypothetical protein ACK55O_13170 [Phycisphaerales bacterium]|jgi:hypothetical protein
MNEHTPQPAPPVLDVAKIIGKTGPEVSAALAVAASAARVLSSSSAVRLSFHGVRGASSSFFNALLLELHRLGGADAIPDRLMMDFDSGAQKFVYDRSLNAYLKSHQPPRAAS